MTAPPAHDLPPSTKVHPPCQSERSRPFPTHPEWNSPGIDKMGRLWYDKKKSGELVQQAERKSSNFDPLPDADNAAVGSHSLILSGVFLGNTPDFLELF